MWHDNIGEFHPEQILFWETPFNLREIYINKIVYGKNDYETPITDYVIKLNYFEHPNVKNWIVVDKNKVKFYKKTENIMKNLRGEL